MKISLLIGIFFFILCPVTGQQQDFAHIDFTRAEANARQYKGEKLSNLPVLTAKLTAYLETDAERFRAIYYWVTHNIEGNNHLLSTNERKLKKLRNLPDQRKQWQQNFTARVFATLQKDKSTVCTGYAYLLKKMAHYAGIECEIVNGFGLANNKIFKEGDFPNHAWNAVKLNGKWYLCDATWAAGYTLVTSDSFEFDYDNRYFLMAPQQFAKSHKPLEQKWYLNIKNTISQTGIH